MKAVAPNNLITGLDRLAKTGSQDPQKRAAISIGGFTLIELLTVIAIIGLLAGMLVGLAPMASRSMRIKRVQADLQHLVTAIEDYKDKFGSYPPDNRNPQTQRNADPVVNQLLYELSGMVYDPKTKLYRSLERNATLSPAVVESAFRIKGFQNASETAGEVKNYMRGFKTNQIAQVQVGAAQLDMLAVAVKGPGDPMKPNLWRYVSSFPTNNPNSFDLWADIVVGKDKLRISNWRHEPEPLP